MENDDLKNGDSIESENVNVFDNENEEGLKDNSANHTEINEEDSIEDEQVEKENTKEKEFLNDSYFDEDELILAGDDKEVVSEKDLAIFEQSENIVSWEVDNFYDENDKPRSRSSLRKDPPVFRITSSSGDSAEFNVTKELASSLEYIFGAVYAGYFGVDKNRKKFTLTQEGIKDLSSDWARSAKESPIKVLIAIVLVLMLIISFVIN